MALQILDNDVFKLELVNKVGHMGAKVCANAYLIELSILVFDSFIILEYRLELDSIAKKKKSSATLI